MRKEIEKRFLVTQNTWKSLKMTSNHLEQGYLVEQGILTVRVRCCDNASAYLTLKGPSDSTRLVRDEYEYEIPVSDARELLRNHACGRVISKWRHCVNYEGFEWEVDVFENENSGLVIAEIEIETTDVVFPIPPWCGREITAERAYSNRALSKHPWSEWQHNIKKD